MLRPPMKSCPACGLLYPDESTFCFLEGQTLRTNDDPLVGSTLDGLVRIESPLVASGWSRNYTGRYRLVARPCVVKLLDLGAHVDGFEDASITARRSSHANVLPMLAARLVGNTALIVTPAVEAQPLSLLVERARLDASQAAGLALQVLAAVARIHDFGGVHGNLRPSNALYWPNGHLDVEDVAFGRALVREPWEDRPDSLAAQHYLAPELSNHQRSSREADVYAVGVMAFELLTGRRPHLANDVRSLRASLSDERTGAELEAALAAVPAPLARWTTTMLSRVPQQRPDNGRHALELLQQACRDAGVAPMVDPGRPELPRSTELDPGLARWERYRGIFGRMLELGFPSGPTEQARTGFAAISERVERLASVAKRATFEQGNHDDAMQRALAGRERLAAQIAKTTAGGEEIRRAIAHHKAESAARGERVAEFPPRVLEAHREVVQWEGRSGFLEPYQELVSAYRKVADLVAEWHDARQHQLAADREAVAQRERLHGIDEEVDEIRQALRIHESNVGGEITASESGLAALGQEADHLESELLEFASRFTAPLRSKPELGPCFRDLMAR